MGIPRACAKIRELQSTIDALRAENEALAETLEWWNIWEWRESDIDDETLEECAARRAEQLKRYREANRNE
jgi:hypothetical protein